MSEQEVEYLSLKSGEPCPHPGCLSHTSHACELCGRIAGKGRVVFRNPKMLFEKIPHKQAKQEKYPREWEQIWTNIPGASPDVQGLIRLKTPEGWIVMREGFVYDPEHKWILEDE